MASFPTNHDALAFVCTQNSHWVDLTLLTSCFISLLVTSLSCYHRWLYVLCSQELFEKDGAILDVLEPEEIITTSSRLIAILETFVLAVDIVFGIVLLLHGGSSQDCPFAFAPVLFSVYLFVLLAGRSYDAEFGLKSHSVSLYAVQCIITAIIAPTMIVDQTGWVRTSATLIRLAMFTTIFLFHCTAPMVPTDTSYMNYVLSQPGKDQRASLFSRLSFFWINGLLWKAFRRTLEAQDLYHLHRNQMSALVEQKFRAMKVAAPLLWRICYFFKYDILKQGAWGAVMSVVVLCQPVLMMVILQYLSSPNDLSRRTAWLCVSGLLTSGLLTCIAESQCNWIGRNIGAQLRSILISEIYAKVLRKSIAGSRNPVLESETDKKTDAEGIASDGTILNLISVDVEVISEISGSLYLAWVTLPVQFTIGTYLLYKILGISGVIGVAIMITILPLNVLLSKHLMTVQGCVLAVSDTRIQESNEVLNNIRTVKYCAWEMPFRERVLEKRASEFKRLRTWFLWWSINMTFFHSLPIIMTALTCFLFTIVWGNELKTSVAFPALAIFAILRVPLNRMADSITFLMGAQVSIIRIGKFLKDRETNKYTQLLWIGTSLIGFENATLAWPSSRTNHLSGDGSISLSKLPSSRPFRLHGLRINFQPEALNVVSGPSGSGKSSLLLALLGEMELISGRVYFPSKMIDDGEITLQTSMEDLPDITSYCPQEAWIMNRSIRSNILMTFPFNSERYETVLYAVALLQDLASFDQGDQTIAGENGTKLSGGQKQRVALARALYSPSKYIFLDDCLSAVDSHTANHIFFHAIKGSLMHGRTCIFATHNTQLVMPHCQYIVMLDCGKVKAQGNREQLMSSGFIDSEMMKDNARPLPATLKTPPTSGHYERNPKANRSSSELTLSENESLRRAPHIENLAPNIEYGESKAEGAVPWYITQIYLSAMGSRCYWIVVLLGFAVQQGASLGTRLWIKEWASQYDRRNTELSMVSSSPKGHVKEHENIDARYYWMIYSVIGISYALITFLRDMFVFYGSLHASSTLYERLLDSMLYAKLLFFDRVPLGQITNRFSKDIEILDQWLATFAISAFQIACGLVTIVAFISIIIPEFLIIAVVICAAYCCVTSMYIDGARDLKRIEAVERSPLYQQFGETLAGCVSIRAYAQAPAFTAHIHTLIDRLNQPYLLLWASKEWLSLRIGFLSSLIVFSTGTFILWNLDSVDPSAAGLILTYAATFTENILWLVQIYAIIQQNLNSVERIVEYSEVEQEATEPLRRATQNLPYDWPSQGVIKFRNFTTRYAPGLDPALKGIDFVIGAGERVAIVGRTGAGKSTLALALIRGLEAEPDGGHIEIDGIDIASVTLKQLREAVTIVPQEPKLFEGTLRDNLDPLHQSNDEEMLGALRTVHLLGATSESSVTYNDLDRVAETLSRGQRQLLCIARGLLRRSRVLLLDEATVSIDRAADIAVQAGLKEAIAAGTTVLTIAHRLRTIANYDRVVVLDAGQVVEEGSIRELLDYGGEGSLFYRMCEESGDMEEIKRTAFGVYFEEAL